MSPTLLHASASLGSAWTWAIATLMFAGVSHVLHPQAINAIKVAMVAPMMIAVMMITGFTPMTMTSWAAIVSSSVLGLVLADLAYMYVLKTAGPTLASLCIPVIPPATAVLAWFVLDEALSMRMVIGMTLTIAGVLLVVTRPGGGAATSPRVLVLMLFYVLCQACANVATKTVLGEGVAPMQVAGSRILAGAIAVWALVPVFGGRRLFAPLTKPMLLRCAIASVIGTALGMMLGSYGLSGLPAGVAVTIAGTTPVWLVLLRWWIEGERPTWRLAMAVVLAMVGILLFAC